MAVENPADHDDRSPAESAIMKPLSVLFCGSIAGFLFLVVRTTGHIEPPPQAAASLREDERIDAAVQRVDEWLRNHWKNEEVEPTVDPLTLCPS